MRKRPNRMQLKTLFVILMTGVMAAGAWAGEDGYALLIQQSPLDGGSVNLGVGVHRVAVGQTVTLSATPKDGYTFAYWLGGVDAADSRETSIQVDSPKLVVAVFTRDQFEDGPAAGALMDGAGGGDGGGGGQRGGFNPLQGAAAVSPASGPADISYPSPVPVPGTRKEIPVTGVPEPATLVLLGLGAAAVAGRKHRRH